MNIPSQPYSKTIRLIPLIAKINLLTVLFCNFNGFSQSSINLKVNDSTQLRLSSLKIDVTIIGDFSKTIYDMEFYNDLDRTLEGELSFPLAEGQSVSQFSMEVNGNLRDAVIVEKELARVAFESTIRQQIDPGLLEKTEGNNYKARVYPILSKKNKRVVLGFEQKLLANNHHYTYSLPLGLKKELDHFSLQINILNGNTLPRIKSENYSDFYFKEVNGEYKASLTLKAHKPGAPLIVEIPFSNDAIDSKSYKDFFYINKRFNTASRLKEKPKKLSLLWDTSYSLQNRNIDKELELLDDYFNYLRNVEVELITFSNDIQHQSIFSISNGDWNELKNLLLATKYDGGTSLNLKLKSALKSDEVLLFTDGLANLGEFPIKNKKPVYTINSSTSADHEVMNEIAISSGGNYLNLIRLPHIEALNSLKQETFQFLGFTPNTSLFEVYPNQNTNVNGEFSISGRFTDDTAIELLFGYRGKVTERITIPVSQSNKNQIVRRLWAKQKLKNLNKNKDKNQASIVSHAKSYHLITDYTSMLILDRIEDYVRYRIEPPKELKAEYKEGLRKLENEEADALADINFRKEELLENYESIIDWYHTTYPEKNNKSKRSTTSGSDNNSTANRDTRDRSSTQIVSNSTIDSTTNFISGTILDEDDIPLPGVNVRVRTTNIGTETDFDGKFTIEAKKDDELVISFIGYVEVNYVVGEVNALTISMKPDASELDEVVVVGYGTERRSNSTGAVTQIMSNALQGQAAGVQITNDSSTENKIIIRGSNSINAESNPLYIIDGVPVSGNLTTEIKPEDLESVQVLKAMNATAIYGSMAANGVIIITTKKGLETNQASIESLEKQISEKIEYKPWNPETPYLDILKKEQTIDGAYNKYLEIRNTYSNSPSFYLDVSDFFDRKGASKRAITILTNLMEIELNNHELMKALAYKLEYFNQFELATIVYEKIRDLRPEEPQSYRDLALAYESTGRIQESYDLLYSIYNGDLLVKDPEQRFDGIEQIVYVELCRLVNKYERKLKLPKKDRDRFNKIPVDIRIVIDWNHNDTDIDLWVVDPRDEKAFFKNAETYIGGRISEDMTEGYGPEEFMLKNAIKGKYQVLIDYYSDSVQKISGPTILKVTLFTNYGKSNEKKVVKILRLGQEEEELEVGNLVF